MFGAPLVNLRKGCAPGPQDRRSAPPCQAFQDENELHSSLVLVGCIATEWVGYSLGKSGHEVSVWNPSTGEAVEGEFEVTVGYMDTLPQKTKTHKVSNTKCYGCSNTTQHEGNYSRGK